MTGRKISDGGESNKRYNLSMPQVEFDEAEEEANREYRSISDFLKFCINLGLYLYKKSKQPNTEILIREKGKPDKEIHFL